MKKYAHRLKPKKRSKIRLVLGRLFYTYRRYLWWMTHHDRFAGEKSGQEFPFCHYRHQTPLIRKLKGADMDLQYNKVVNLRIATERLKNIVVYPGEILSYWRIIGKPMRSKGYLDGMVLFYGTVRPGTGGGLCQLSNLIYWMTLHTPLTVKERHRHSYDVFPDQNRMQPFGSGATCVYNFMDLIIENNTNMPYQLCLQVKDSYLQGEWRSIFPNQYRYEVYEKEHLITLEYWGRYVRHNIINRRVFNLEGQMIDDEYITENHAIMMYQPFLEECEINK